MKAEDQIKNTKKKKKIKSENTEERNAMLNDGRQILLGLLARSKEQLLEYERQQDQQRQRHGRRDVLQRIPRQRSKINIQDPHVFFSLSLSVLSTSQPFLQSF